MQGYGGADPDSAKEGARDRVMVACYDALWLSHFSSHKSAGEGRGMKWTPIQHVTGFVDEGYRVGIERNGITGCRLRAKFATMDIKARA